MRLPVAFWARWPNAPAWVAFERIKIEQVLGGGVVQLNPQAGPGPGWKIHTTFPAWRITLSH